MALAVSIGSDSISLYSDGDFYTVDKTHPNYNAVLTELRKPTRDLEAIKQMMDIPRFAAHITAGRVQVGEDGITFDGNPVSGYMVERMLKMASEGDDITPWAVFMDNLMDNPLPSIRDDLYKWMEAGKMPITADGCIVAFKKVRADYKDVHSGRFDNSVGAMLEMDRSLCDTNRNNTCSTGFHFCSAGYLGHFSGNKVMVVKINPRDVTAIPSDYNNHKARCCRYTVTGELSSESAARHKVWTEKNTVNLEDPRELPEVLLPRAGKKLSELPNDPARADGAPPADDLAPAPAKPSAKAAAKGKAPAKAAAKKSARKAPRAGAKGKTKAPAAPPAPAVQTTAAAMAADIKAGLASFTSSAGTFTEQQIRDAVAAAGGKITPAGKALGVAKTTFLGWATKLGLTGKP